MLKQTQRSTNIYTQKSKMTILEEKEEAKSLPDSGKNDKNKTSLQFTPNIAQ